MRSKIIFIFYLWINVTLINGQGRSCTTPNGEIAHCIPIHSCTKLYDAVTTTDKQQLKFLKESQCGYRRQPLVCCGSDDNYKTEENNFNNYDPFNWNDRTTKSYVNDDSWGNNNRRVTNRKPTPNNWESDENSRENWGGRPTSSENRRPTNDKKGKLPDRTSCGFQEVDRILDGQVTGLREFPWMALLQYRKKNGNLAFSCGGTIISSRYILTAAHCVRGQILTKIGPLINVRLGEYNTETDRDCNNQLGFQICNDKPVDSEIDNIIVHPDYSDSNVDRYNDIALVKLKQSITFTDFIKPICLPTKSEKSRVGERLVVAGWGRTEYASSSPVKLKLWVPVVESNQCSSKFRSAGVTLGNKQLCAGGERGRDSCNGDSGGPLMATSRNDTAQWYIEGIVSFGARCGSEDWPGIYTKVAEYIDWIKANAV